MKEEDLARISALHKKSLSQELTKEEKEEQAKLREEYIMAIRGNLRNQLEHISIQNPDGSVVKVTKKEDKMSS